MGLQYKLWECRQQLSVGGTAGYRLQSWGAGHPVDTRLTLAVSRQSRLFNQSSTASPEA